MTIVLNPNTTYDHLTNKNQKKAFNFLCVKKFQDLVHKKMLLNILVKNLTFLEKQSKRIQITYIKK